MMPARKKERKKERYKTKDDDKDIINGDRVSQLRAYDASPKKNVKYNFLCTLEPHRTSL